MGSWMLRPIDRLLPSNAPTLAASMMPGAATGDHAEAGPTAARAISTVRWYQVVRLDAAEPKIDTAGCTGRSFSVA